MSSYRVGDTIDYLKSLRDTMKPKGNCDPEVLCKGLGVGLGELVYMLIFFVMRLSVEKVRYRDMYLQKEQDYKYMEKALNNAYENGNRKQAALLKAGKPIAKKRSKLGELRLLMKLGNTDEDLMKWFDISRTTLWRWKKELHEWEQQGKF